MSPRRAATAAFAGLDRVQGLPRHAGLARAGGEPPVGVADEDRRLEHVGHASAETTVGRLEALGPLRRLAEHEQAPPRYLGEHEGRVDGLDGRLRVVADQSHTGERMN
jgi:hypothetical protein